MSDKTVNPNYIPPATVRYSQNKRLDRRTALEVLKDLSRDMYPSYDLFGRKTLVINRDDFESIRAKYLDDMFIEDLVVSTPDEKDALIAELKTKLAYTNEMLSKAYQIIGEVIER